jgi:peptidoglycan/LPS O-acetylase OafA/YrhL
MKYRSEIDGLRTVAVIPVILFHAGFEVFSGGFVGVDVFFVLSGYLITSIIAGEMAQGRFSIARFYERRARRILPALYFVMLATLPVAFHLMLPDEFAEFCRTFMSVIVFASNIYFWRTTNYFARSAEENPLLHTWSLAVEEQYYMLFPLALLLLWRFRARGAFWGVAMLTVASLAVAEIGWRTAPVPNFFLLPSRAWELGIGALAALHLLRIGPDAPTPRHAGLLSAIGLAMVIASVFIYSPSTPFPSVYALVPTVGTVLVILYGRSDASAGRLLSLRPIVFLGLISYSAYLWHQPLFAFARLTTFGPPGPVLMLGLSALSLVLATLSWRYVERPFRDRARIPGPAILRYSLGASAALLLIGAVAPMLARIDTRYPPEMRQFTDVTYDQRVDYVEDAYDKLINAEFKPGGGRKLLILGDSFSQDFYNMLREANAFQGYQIVTRRVNSNCQLYLGPEDVRALMEPPVENCLRAPGAKDFVGIAQQADVVVFALSFRPWSGARIMETIDNFGFRPDQKVVVIGRKNFGYFNARAFLRMDQAELPALRNQMSDLQLETNAAMETLVPPSMFVDTQRILCGAGSTTCPLFTPAGDLIAFDGNHLTQAGARYLGGLLFQDPLLAPYAANVRADAAP